MCHLKTAKAWNEKSWWTGPQLACRITGTLLASAEKKNHGVIHHMDGKNQYEGASHSYQYYVSHCCGY